MNVFWIKIYCMWSLTIDCKALGQGGRKPGSGPGANGVSEAIQHYISVAIWASRSRVEDLLDPGARIDGRCTLDELVAPAIIAYHYWILHCRILAVTLTKGTAHYMLTTLERRGY